ncbi:MAG: Arginine--tRNA ligase [Candidatus Heimdallarchaeota archaeon AB_125]|nr:MAG: Arginine--tRNA ligase [Candidatus Heimdallarchaeota archaeon AB_125]
MKKVSGNCCFFPASTPAASTDYIDTLAAGHAVSPGARVKISVQTAFTVSAGAPTLVCGLQSDTDAGFADRSRQCVVRLQSGDEHTVSIWQHIVNESLSHCDEVYQRLYVSLARKDIRGESEYKDELPGIIEELKNKNLADVLIDIKEEEKNRKIM